MLEPILWGVIGVSCGVVGSTVYDMVKQKGLRGRLTIGGNTSMVVCEPQTGLEFVQPKTRFCVHQAMNGRILEMSTHKPNPHGPDWSSDFYLLREGEKLSEALALVITMKGLSE